MKFNGNFRQDAKSNEKDEKEILNQIRKIDNKRINIRQIILGHFYSGNNRTMSHVKQV